MVIPASVLSEGLVGTVPQSLALERMSGVESVATAGCKRKASALMNKHVLPAATASAGTVSNEIIIPAWPCEADPAIAAAASDHSDGTHCSGSSGAESSRRISPSAWQPAILPALPALDLRIPLQPALTCPIRAPSPLLGSSADRTTSAAELDSPKKIRLTGA